MSMLKEHINFPTIFTFKIVGDNTPVFPFDVETIFTEYEERSIQSKLSQNCKYISYTVTVEIKEYEELEKVYASISELEGLKFHI